MYRFLVIALLASYLGILAGCSDSGPPQEPTDPKAPKKRMPPADKKTP